MGIVIKERFPGKWYVNINWKGQRRSKAFSTQAEAHHYAEQMTALMLLEKDGTLAKLAAEAETTPSLREFAARWLEERKPHLAEKTYVSYAATLRLHILPILGPIPLDELRYADMKRLAIAKSKSGLRKDSIRTIFATLSAMLSEAVNEDIIPANPVQTRTLSRHYGGKTRREEKEMVPFTLQELHHLEAVATAHFSRWALLVMVLARTGMRWGEATALRWEDIDWERRQVRVSRSRQIGTLRVKQPKTESSTRNVDLSPELVARLEEKRRKSGWIFSTRGGHLLSPPNFQRVWEKMLAKAELRYRNLHNLRHTFASILLSMGEPILYVSRQLGHSTPNTTLSVYSRWIPSEDADPRVRRLDKSATEKGEEKVNSATNPQQAASNVGANKARNHSQTAVKKGLAGERT